MTTGKQVFSTITSAGQLELSIADIEIPTPGPDDVVVRIDAAPINPSDMGPLFGPASIDKANLEDTKLVGQIRKKSCDLGERVFFVFCQIVDGTAFQVNLRAAQFFFGKIMAQSALDDLWAGN